MSNGFLYFGDTARPGTNHRTRHPLGPSGRDGIVSAHGSMDASRCHYDAAAQTWIDCRDGFWVGVWNDAKPSPEDLVRDQVMAGHLVRLGDGNEWLIPAVTEWREPEEAKGAWLYVCRLARRLVLGASGRLEPGAVVAAHERLWRLTEEWLTEQRLAFDDVTAAEVDALAVNYRLGPAECALLGLLDTESWHAVLDALVDMPGRMELQKKMGPGGGSGSGGSGG